MATSMTKAQILATAKATAMERITLPDGIVQTGDYTYVFPIDVDGQTVYVECALTAKDFTATKVRPAFSADDAHAEYLAMVDERKAKEQERIRIKEEKLAKAKAKAQSK